MSKEVWNDIDGFPGYQISSRGRVKGFRDFHGNVKKEGTILKPLLNKDDYYEICLYTSDHKKVKKRIHRLVLDAFVGHEPLKVVNHINGDKHDNRLANLEWVTPSENSRLAAEAGLYKTKPIKIIETGETFKSIKECAKVLKVHPSDISHVISGKTDSVRGLHFEYTEIEKSQFLYDYQMDAVNKMFSGCILNGGTGSGKSRTGLYYYFKEQGGSIIDSEYIPMQNPKDLYIITTAMKRDSLEWEKELTYYRITNKPELSMYDHNVTIDSWNNIKKYVDVKNAFFIFDEQRVAGTGVWVRSFLKIVKNNEWILLSALPGDCWMDYIPVFIANGFYKNKTEFLNEHVVYSRFTKYPKIDRYINTGRLIRLRNKLLIDMDIIRHTVPHHEDIYCSYDIKKYKEAMKTRWDPYKNEPMQGASSLCYVLRRIVNSDDSRQVKLLELLEKHPRAIIFYNFDYERDMLKSLYYGEGVEIAEWNGHAHQPIPESDKWVYLVQYIAGCEGWNCTNTDTIIFYSQHYSYKVLKQAEGRINRLNTPYIDLYYYHFKSRSGIDLAISKAISEKKQFNEGRWVERRRK